MEIEIGFPSHLITHTLRTVGKNNSSANMTAHRMHQTLHDAHDHRMSLIGTKRGEKRDLSANQFKIIGSISCPRSTRAAVLKTSNNEVKGERNNIV